MIALEQLGIEYAIGGSVAAMEYSAPRFTVDIDLMLTAETAELARLVEEVKSWQIYISPLEAILETDIPHGLPFNIMDGSAGTKADLFVVPPSGLSGAAMSRRRRRTWDDRTGVEAWFLAPEDVILYKLSYYRKSGETAPKHPTDITKMLAVVGHELDLTYIKNWAAEIGVADLWQALWDEFQKK
ncbi:MAG: hypothetical protein HY023_00445 [Chloroflexi bacterium]|nr:hypothetical protein [Chloroflexota bacterium]